MCRLHGTQYGPRPTGLYQPPVRLLLLMLPLGSKRQFLAKPTPESRYCLSIINVHRPSCLTPWRAR